MDADVLKLAAQFTEVIGRHSYDWVVTKMSQAKNKRKLEEQQIAYEEIINSLLQDKMDLESVAREYKKLYENITISDEDIEYLQETIHRVMELIKVFSPDINKQQENIDILISLINKDTLKTMQLLGFNYKEAIGTPLTEVCANTIRKHLGGNKSNKSHRRK